MYIYIYIIYIYMYMYTYISSPTLTLTSAGSVGTGVDKRTGVLRRAYIYMYINIYTHTYIYIYMYIHKPPVLLVRRLSGHLNGLANRLPWASGWWRSPRWRVSSSRALFALCFGSRREVRYVKGLLYVIVINTYTYIQHIRIWIYGYIYIHIIFFSGSFCALFWLKKRGAQCRRHTLYVIVIYTYTFIIYSAYMYIYTYISSSSRVPFALYFGPRREVRNVEDTHYMY